MKRLTKQVVRRTATASLLVAGVALATEAGAASYAVSTDTITGFGLSFSGSVLFSGFTFSADSAAQNGVGTANVGTNDAPASCINCSYSNSFTAHATPSWFSYGDAQIMDANVQAGSGAAASIGETRVVNGVGTAYGNNTMIAGFYVNAPSSAAFSFNAAPYMASVLTAGGMAATANTEMTITIRDGLGATVFQWAPDGAAGGITGGSETSDPFSLNSGLGLSTLGNVSYSPGSGAFLASTALLPVGTYQLNITMKDTAIASAVPVPAAIWLLGSGLLGLAGLVRRRGQTV